MSVETSAARRPSRPPPRRRSFISRTWFLFVLLILGAAAGGAYYYYTYETIATAEVAQVQRGTALAGVYGTVDVEPVNQVVVRTRNFGQISAMDVKEGDAVHQGQTLAEMLDESMQRQVDSINSALAQAEVRRSMGPPSLAAEKNAEIELDKLQKLVAAKDIAPVEYDKEQNELASLKQQVQNETMSLNTDVENIQRSLEALKDQMGQMRITAPIDGVVLNLYANLGEFVPPQTQLCRIGSAANQIVAQVNEEDVGYLQPGMKAKIRLYAHQDKDLIGTLTEILPQAENQVYRVLFSLDNPPATLLPGMTGEMNIIIGERKNTLTIPSRAVRHGDEVLEVVDGRVELVHIRTGFHTLERTEVLEGLTEGTSVILSNQDLYKPGLRVRELITKPD
jgi:RND family efflux transporter MFP subunit